MLFVCTTSPVYKESKMGALNVEVCLYQTRGFRNSNFLSKLKHILHKWGGVHFIIFLGLWINVSKRAQGKNMLTNMNLQYQLSHSEQRTMLTTLDSSGGMLMARSEICSTHVSRVMRIQSTGGSQFRGTLYS